MQRSSVGGWRAVVQRCACPTSKSRSMPKKNGFLSFVLLIDSCCETCRFARAEHSLRRANSNFETASVLLWSGLPVWC